MSDAALLTGGPDHQHEYAGEYIWEPGRRPIRTGGEMMVLLFCSDLEVTLLNQGEVYRKQDNQYELVFPDSEENRLRIPRFLLGSYSDEVPHQAMMDLLNPNAHAVRIQTVDEQFVIWHQESGRGSDTVNGDYG